MCSAGVIVGNAGQNTVADLAVAARPAILIPEDRPFGEQHAIAEMQRGLRLATVTPHWPDVVCWPELRSAAAQTPSDRWSRWETEGAARRAAAVIEEVAAR
jgi:predicted glycosyltransferase